MLVKNPEGDQPPFSSLLLAAFHLQSYVNSSYPTSITHIPCREATLLIRDAIFPGVGEACVSQVQPINAGPALHRQTLCGSSPSVSELSFPRQEAATGFLLSLLCLDPSPPPTFLALATL